MAIYRVTCPYDGTVADTDEPAGAPAGWVSRALFPWAPDYVSYAHDAGDFPTGPFGWRMYGFVQRTKGSDFDP